MDAFIKRIVATCPRLSLKVNEGPRYRISHHGIPVGSLWFAPRKKRGPYRVLLTGEVELTLGKIVASLTSRPVDGYDQEHPYWMRIDSETAEKIIRQFDSS